MGPLTQPLTASLNPAMPAWQLETIDNSGSLRARLPCDGRPARFDDVLAAWHNDEAFCAHWCDMLAGLPMDACFWELPPLTPASERDAFECVMRRAPDLATAQPRAQPFAEHFERHADPTEAAAVFASLGRDALMIAPCPRAPHAAYTHLLAFVRAAPRWQAMAIWPILAREVASLRASGARQPLWISTSGSGVHWLHLRLDSRPKYYQHEPYTQPSYRSAVPPQPT
jgi:hypothetical protein